MITCASAFTGANNTNTYPGHYHMARSYHYENRFLLSDHTGFTNGEIAAMIGTNWGDAGHVSGYQNLLPYPNPADFSLVLTKSLLRGQRSGLRGINPGIYITPHYRPLPPGSVVKNVPSLPGRELMCFDIPADSSTAPAQFYVDMTGPWRAQ